MGIHGLSQFYTKQTYNIKDYCINLQNILNRIPIIGFDAMVLLHKYLMIEAENICKIENFIPNISYNTIIKLLKGFQNCGYDLYVVFDGKLPNIKFNEREKREEKRKIALENNKWECAFKITPLIINEFIKKLEEENIKYIVAPYEADPQLYYMEKTHIIDIIYTIDTDLIAYGCKRIIYNLIEDNILVYENLYDNHIINLDIENLEDQNGKYIRCKRIRQYPEINAYDTIQYRLLSVLLGNDYVKKIYGLGPVKIKKVMENIKLYFYDEQLNSIDYKRTIEHMLDDEIIKKCIENQSKKNKCTISKLRTEFIENFIECCTLYHIYPIYDIRDKKYKTVDSNLIDTNNKIYEKLFGIQTLMN